MAIFICDAGLFSKGSHHYNWVRHVSAELAGHGAAPRIFAYQHAAPDVLSDTGAIGYFRDLLYNKHCNQIPFDEEHNWRSLNASFRADMERLESEIAQPDALVIIPAVTQHQIEGLAQWFLSLQPARRPKLAVSLMFHPSWTPWGDRAIRGTEFYARALSCFAPFIGRSVLLYTETRELKEYFEALTGLSIEAAPIPWGAPKLYGLGAPRNGVRFGYFGHSRDERGFHLLPDAVRFCLEAGLSFELVVQIQHGNFEPATSRAAELLCTQSNVCSILGPIESDHYYRLLDGCDVILIPYSPDMYRTRGSGLFADAIIYGKPIVVTAGTAMAQAAERGECVARLCEFHSPGLAEAMIDVAGSHRDLGTQALQLGNTWYALNNAKTYCARLMDFAGRAGTVEAASSTIGTGTRAVEEAVPSWPLGRIEEPFQCSFDSETAVEQAGSEPSSATVMFISREVRDGGTLILDFSVESADSQAPINVTVKINGHIIAALRTRPERKIHRIENAFRWLVDDVPSVLAIEAGATEAGLKPPLLILYGWGFQPRSGVRKFLKSGIAKTHR